jgi:hypothetical protein
MRSVRDGRAGSAWLLTLADAGVAHVLGVLALAGAGLAIFTAVGPDEVAAKSSRVFVRERR